MVCVQYIIIADFVGNEKRILGNTYKEVMKIELYEVIKT